MRIHYQDPHQLIQHFEFSSFELCWSVTAPVWTTDLCIQILGTHRFIEYLSTLNFRGLPKTKSYDSEHSRDDPWTLGVMTISMGSLLQGLTTLSEKNLLLKSHMDYQIICATSFVSMPDLGLKLCWQVFLLWNRLCDSWRAGEHWGIISQINLSFESVCSHTGLLQENSSLFFPNV